MLEKLILILLTIGANIVLNGMFWQLPSKTAWIVTIALVILIITL